MDNATETRGPGQESRTPFIDIAGYKASAGYASLPGRVLSRTPEDLDKASLEKLWHTGFDVADLDEAHQRWKISPLRSVSDVYTLLGHQKNPVNAKGGTRFTEDCLTSLAIQYPSLIDRGEVYPHGKIIRLRYPAPVYTIRGKSARGGPGVEQRRYDQPLNQSDERSTSEPYFLFHPEQYDKLYDTTCPLLMTEGELKGCALGLAGFAAIAWGGVHMWAAPKKSGKGKLHPTLDPTGPCKSWAIPILDRPIYLIPDIDFWTNQSVRKAFTALGHALLHAGATNVRVIRLPNPARPEHWKGVDDYLTYQLGTRWSGDEQKTSQAVDIIESLLKNNSVLVRTSGRYGATSVAAGSDRLYDMLQDVDHRYTAVLTGQSFEGTARVGWLSYRDDRYVMHRIDQTVGNTSGKVTVPEPELQNLAEEVYEMGVEQAIADGEITEKPPEMPTDYPNHLLAAVNRRLPERGNNTLIEPFAGVRAGDFCIRTDRALLNLTKYFDTFGAWDRRDEWLLPPNPRWFGTGCMNVSLANLADKPQCPLFMDMLEHGFDGDRQSIDCLQLFFGKVVANPMFQGMQQFLALYGEAGGGKSTLYRLLVRLLGPLNVAILRAQFSGRFDTANLPGKKLAVFQETPDGVGGEYFSQYMAEIIKSLTGQDTIVYERKGHDARATQVDADVLTIGNDPPVIPMNAEAFRRRVVFLRMFRKLKSQDFRVEQRMAETELAGIFLWALDGAMRLHMGAKFTTPDRNREDLEDVTSAVAPEERYVATQFRLVPEREADKHKLSNEAIFEHYQAWVRQHHGRVQTVNIKKLGILIRRHFPGLETKIGAAKGHTFRYYPGLAFINPLF